MKPSLPLLTLILLAGLAGCSRESVPSAETSGGDQTARSPSAISLAGEPLFSPKPSEEMLNQLQERRRDFESDPNDPDKLIWYGRFVAYCGDYNRAIEIFNQGATQFPNDARMLRHAGHRYISIRKFDQAIEVLKRASQMVAGQPNEVEPDGMPNDRNIPVSTLHGNIWYHLGLAYYLKQDFENALRAYEHCLATANRPDNVVSATHWIYMINRRLGREQAAAECLELIELEMDVIENMGYHQCCCFYKGLIPLDALETAIKDGLQREAIDYAIGNWFLYNGEREKARQRMQELTSAGTSYAFGLIAAESDLAFGALDDGN